MADKNFIVKNGLEVGGQEVVSSSGVVTSAALGGQTLASTDSPTFANLTVSNDLAVSGDLNLTGDLNITGDVNSLSVTDLDVTDQTITLGAGQVESASGGSGIVVDGSGASILWDETNSEWDFNKSVNITTTSGNGITIDATQNTSIRLDSDNNTTGPFMIRVNSDEFHIKNQASSGFGTGGSFLKYTDGGSLQFLGDGLVVTSSDFVSIGHTDPDNKLHIQGAGVTGGIFVEDTNNSSASPVIKVQGNRSDGNVSQSFTGGLALSALRTGALASDGKHIGTIYFGTNHTDGTAANIAYSASIAARLSGDANSATDMPTDLVFYTGSTGRALGTSGQTYGDEALRIDSSGNVGIGTSSPSYKLHTRVTSGNIRNIIVAENTGSGSLEAGITVKNSAGEGRFVIGSSDHVFIENATEGKDLRFLTFPSGGTTGTEAMRILHTGRVGIGEDLPNANLHIGAASATGDATNPALQIGGASTYRLGMFTTAEGGVIDNANGDDGLQFHTKNAGEAVRITADGNLQMIAQTSSFANPGFTYHTNNYLYCRGGSAGLILSDDSGINTVQIIDGSAGYINFETGDGSSRMRINSSRLEIDPTNDRYKFTYDGSSFNEGLRMAPHSNDYSILTLGAGTGDSGSVDGQWTIARHPDADNNKFTLRHQSDSIALTVLKSGNVGIGVDAPSQKLEVDGRIKLGGMILQNTSDGGSIGFNRNPADGAYIGNASLRRFQVNGPNTVGGDFWEFQSYNSSGTHQGNIRIQDGRLGIGTTPSEMLHIYAASGNGPEIRMQNSASSHYIRAYNDNWNFYANATNTAITIKNSGAVECPVQLTAGSTQYDTEGNLICYGSGRNSLIIQTPDNSLDRGIAFRNSGAAYIGNIYLANTGSNVGDLVFGVSNTTETDVTNVPGRMRITSDGTVCVNATSSGSLFTKLYVEQNESANNRGPAIFTNPNTGTAHRVVTVNTGGNSDLIVFDKGFSSVGKISVSGGTVSYEAFMGSHYSESADNLTNILKGTVMETVDSLVEDQYEGQKRLAKCKVSDTSESNAVYGIWLGDANKKTIAAIGASWCRINSGVTVSKGDLLVSNGDGTAKVQSDDIIRSKTIGKVTANITVETYSDGSYLVPVVLYCG